MTTRRRSKDHVEVKQDYVEVKQRLRGGEAKTTWR